MDKDEAVWINRFCYSLTVVLFSKSFFRSGWDFAPQIVFSKENGGFQNVADTVIEFTTALLVVKRLDLGTTSPRMLLRDSPGFANTRCCLSLNRKLSAEKKAPSFLLKVTAYLYFIGILSER